MSGRFAGKAAMVTGGTAGGSGSPSPSTAARSSTCPPSPRPPAPGIGLYGASKAMLGHLTAGLAVELGPPIRINAVAPAVV